MLKSVRAKLQMKNYGILLLTGMNFLTQANAEILAESVHLKVLVKKLVYVEYVFQFAQKVKSKEKKFN